MLKACPYCGRIHDSRYDCGKKPKARPKADTATQRFRGSGAWKTKREQIRKRDKGLCQLCLRGYAGTQRQYEYDDLSGLANNQNISIEEARRLIEDPE